jgi:hypothetical protein
MSDDGVRYDLFVGRIMLGRGAGEKEIVPARQKGTEVSLRLKVQTLERTEFIKKASLNDKDVFLWWICGASFKGPRRDVSTFAGHDKN